MRTWGRGGGRACRLARASPLLAGTASGCHPDAPAAAGEGAEISAPRRQTDLAVVRASGIRFTHRSVRFNNFAATEGLDTVPAIRFLAQALADAPPSR